MDPNKQPENIAKALAIANEWNFRMEARIEELEKELETCDQRTDRAWISGAKFGWNCTTKDDLLNAISAKQKSIDAARAQEGKG